MVIVASCNIRNMIIFLELFFVRVGESLLFFMLIAVIPVVKVQAGQVERCQIIYRTNKQ